MTFHRRMMDHSERDDSPSRSHSGSSWSRRKVGTSNGDAPRKSYESTSGNDSDLSPMRAPGSAKSRRQITSEGGDGMQKIPELDSGTLSTPKRTPSQFLQLTEEGQIENVIEKSSGHGKLTRVTRAYNADHGKPRNERRSEQRKSRSDQGKPRESGGAQNDVRRSRSIHKSHEERQSLGRPSDHSKKGGRSSHAATSDRGPRSSDDHPVREYRRTNSLTNELTMPRSRSNSNERLPMKSPRRIRSHPHPNSSEYSSLPKISSNNRTNHGQNDSPALPRSPSNSNERLPTKSPRRIRSHPHPISPIDSSLPKISSNNRSNHGQNNSPALKLEPFKSSEQNRKRKPFLKTSQIGTRRNSSNTSTATKKLGTFRPYYVPIKKKRDLLGPTSHHIGSKRMIQVDESDNSPAQILHEGMKNISVAPFLHEGIPVVKVSHNKPGKCRSRFLTLSDDQSTLFLTHSKMLKGAKNRIPKGPTWTPSKGWNGTYMRYIDVANICDFQVGAISSRWLELSIANYPPKDKKESNSTHMTNSMRLKRRTSNESMTLLLDPDGDRIASAITIFHIDPATGRMTALDFFIKDKDHRRAIVATLALMKYTYIEASQLVGNEILLFRYILKDMMLGSNGKGPWGMNEIEFAILCRRLNFTTAKISKEFQEFCKYQSNSKYDDSRRGKNKNKLNFHECLQLLQLLKGKENPSMDIWRDCFGAVNCVKASVVLEKFLHGPQKEEMLCDLQDARDLINIMNATELGEALSNRKGSLLTQWQFEEFLRSEWNDVYDPAKRVVDKQRLLNEPLSHYWINSSFKTCLMSDGTHSIESYTRALLRGCKSIDLICWDGAILPDGDYIPIISPRNKCSKVPSDELTFRSVVMVVRKFLNENRNSYPIMLNLEIGCSQPFQTSMVRILKEIFGKQLFVPYNAVKKKQLPSPEDLRGMIVINAKRLHIAENEVPNKEKIQLDASETSSKTSATDAVKQSSIKSIPSISGSFGTNEYIHELLSLTLFHDSDFTGYFSESMELSCSHIHDFRDTKVAKIANKYADNPSLWRRFNQTHLTRIYPSGKNRQSTSDASVSDGVSNYNPVLAWGMGCQMTTMNFQTHDNDLAINDGLFHQIGGVGYLPKPLWLLGLGERPAPTKLKVRVISGNCIPKASRETTEIHVDDAPIENPCVVVELHDVVLRPEHGEYLKTTKHRVASKNDNGFCPIFDDQGKRYQIETPDVAMLVFRVEQDRDMGKVLGQAAIPVNCLRKGYRSVQLYDADNTRLGRFVAATLLVFLA